VTTYSYFGIEGYQPVWRRGLASIRARHGRRLAGLVGRRLAHVWLLWDLDADEWFADAPVLLDFDGEQLDIQHQKFDEVSTTWVTADPNKPVSFLEFDLAWRSGATPDLRHLEGQHLREISLLEWQGGGASALRRWAVDRLQRSRRERAVVQSAGGRIRQPPARMTRAALGAVPVGRRVTAAGSIRRR
jgi:hypothetical protein